MQTKVRHQCYRIALMIMLTVFAGVLGVAIVSLPELAGLQAMVAEHRSQSGVENAVTAVLLNFRGYDTFLEMTVLLLVVVAISGFGAEVEYSRPQPGLTLDAFIRLLVPLLVMISFYLLWAGAYSPGGAFQAGSILASALVLLILAGYNLPFGFRDRVVRGCLVSSVALFTAITAFTGIGNGVPMQLGEPDRAKGFIVVLEMGAMFSVAATLAFLFVITAPANREFP